MGLPLLPTSLTKYLATVVCTVHYSIVVKSFLLLVYYCSAYKDYSCPCKIINCFVLQGFCLLSKTWRCNFKWQIIIFQAFQKLETQLLTYSFSRK